MKIMYYCQHVLGIGHFFRSMEVAAAFAGHEVLFVEGGEPLAGFQPPAHVRRLLLPPLMMDPEFSRFQANGRDLGAVADQRRRLLLEAFREFRPAALIIELFPFGRKYFRFELLPVLEENLAQPRRALVVCSLRDILVEKENQAAYEDRVLKLLNRYFHLLLVHADPNLVRLEDTFSRVADIAVPIHYTGYVVRGGDHRQRARQRIPGRMVASSGGGKVGADLLEAAIQAVGGIRDRELSLKVFCGPFLDPNARTRLQTLAALDSRVQARPFSSRFLDELAAAELSISMGGYNTTMDLLVTGTRAIVYPFPQNREQGLRARRLEALGLVRVLAAPEPEPLAALIGDILAAAPEAAPRHRLNLEGAAASARLVEKILTSDYVKRTPVSH